MGFGFRESLLIQFFCSPPSLSTGLGELAEDGLAMDSCEMYVGRKESLHPLSTSGEIEGAVVRTYDEYESPLVRQGDFDGDDVVVIVLVLEGGRSSTLCSKSLKRTEVGLELGRTVEMSLCTELVGELSECLLCSEEWEGRVTRFGVRVVGALVVVTGPTVCVCVCVWVWVGVCVCVCVCVCVGVGGWVCVCVGVCACVCDPVNSVV